MPDQSTMAVAEAPREARSASEHPVRAERRMNRRGILGTVSGAVSLAAAFAASRASAQTSAPQVRVKADQDPSSLIERLVDRITFGARPEELTLARTLGYEGYLEYHLNYVAIDDSDANARTAHLTTLTQSFPELILQTTNFVRNELTENAILRAVYGKRQLYERMVELWTDHFNIDVAANAYYKAIDDRNVVRANALGTFPAILTASAHSPAMLYYLNNDVSTAGNPNENYARELMELHTLDVDGGYTQTDVQEVARCLTGWTIWRSGATNGQFRYNSAVHDNTAKTVLGTPIPAGGGQNDGNTVLTLLANHPSTAQFVAFKICRHFLGYDTAQPIIDAVAAAYTSSGGDIKQMIRAALRPEHLAGATPKLKRPFHHFVGALRAMGANVTSTISMQSRLVEAGHRPYTWQTPDGYPDKLNHWSNNVIVRWNWGATASTNLVTGIAFDDAAFFAGAVTANDCVTRIDERLFAGRMPASERMRITTYLLPEPVTASKRREAVGLAISGPAFQWY